MGLISRVLLLLTGQQAAASPPFLRKMDGVDDLDDECRSGGSDEQGEGGGQ